MPRGGKRPGAGAPPGNMNNLKHGLHSKQFAKVGALFASDPKIRETLLALAHRHNLKQQRANEVAALIFTRLFERAENIAARPSAPLKPGTSDLESRLNLAVDADDLGSIKQAATRAAVRQVRTALKRSSKKTISQQPNQTPDTADGSQSN